MPNMPRDEAERSLSDHLDIMMKELVITTVPVVVTGVNRKVNIGNFETVDVYGAVAIPTNVVMDDTLQEVVHQLMSIGYASVSKEVSERYNFIKKSIEAQASSE